MSTQTSTRPFPAPPGRADPAASNAHIARGGPAPVVRGGTADEWSVQPGSANGSAPSRDVRPAGHALIPRCVALRGDEVAALNAEAGQPREVGAGIVED